MSNKDFFTSASTKRSLQLAIGAVVALSANANAQEKVLDEVIVTAQKRAQSLQEVSISVAAVSGESIDKMGVENLEDLTSFIPNIHFTETGISTQMRIRGIGSDNSQGFEQSVGIYMDGINRSRSQLFRAPIFDVERVEVMRGPQATLVGKNSIAGAVDIISAKPTNELSGKLTTSYESEFATKEVSGFVSGPFTESLKGRVALRYYDDPGYMTNTFKNTDEADQKEQAIRTSLDWKVGNNLKFLFIAEYDTFDVQGRGSEMTMDLPAVSGPATGFNYAQALAARNAGVTFDSKQDYQRQSNSPEFSDNKMDSQTLRIDYEMGDISVTAVTGLLGFDYTENCDCDFTPANIFDLDIQEDYSQVSQEIRFMSADHKTITWLAGVFYQSYDQTFTDNFNVPKDSTLLKFVPTLPAAFGGTGIHRDFDQSSDAWAAFAEATWSISSQFDVTLGGRLADENKEAHKVLNVVDLTNNNAILNSPGIGAIYASPIFLVDTEQSSGHKLNGDRNESAFMPSLTVRYHINEDIMSYAKASKGFKAGGFDPRSNNIKNFEFEDEEVVAFELGSKMTVAGGRGEVNVALFKMDYENLQISQFDGAVGFNTGNAKDTLVQGIELDGRWQITEHLTSSYGVSYLDFEYKDFANGNCYARQAAPGTNVCDYTGKRGVYTPEVTLNGTLEYNRELKTGLMLVTSMDMQWVDEQQVHVNLDPLGEIDAYTLLSLRTAVESDHWILALLGKNLLNEDVITYSGNAPLSERLLASNTHYSFLRRPRTIALEATYRF